LQAHTANESRGDSPADLLTAPELLLHHATVRGDKTAMREKEYGIWQSWTWSQMKEEILALANGLASIGFKRGDKLGIIGANRPQLYWGMCAAQCLGGIPVPLYKDMVAEELQYVLEHAGIQFMLAEDQEQVDKVMEVQPECPALTQIIYDDQRGMRDYDHTHLHSIQRVQGAGRELAKEKPDFIQREIEKNNGGDIGILLYTSGTTGKPKGVVLSHDNIFITARNTVDYDSLSDREETLSYLPLAWVGDHIFSYGQAYVAGYCVNCPENETTVATDMREIGPTYYFAPPRIFENMLTSVSIRMDDASAFKQKLFSYFMAVAKKTGVALINGERVSAGEKFKYWLGSILIYGPLKNTLGLSKIRIAYTAGEAIGPEIFEFFRSLGINVKQLYGQTEASVYITIQPDGEVYADTVGVPAPDVEVKIADSGEVIYRSPGVFLEYFKNAESTHETKNDEGWVLTGDAGYFDERGHLKIIDRAKDVGKLNDDSMFAPKYIENKLKFFSQIQEAVVFGDARDYVTAFINIDLEAISNWAERNNISYASYQELAGHPQVYDMILGNIEQVNQDLASDAHLSGSQISRFLILHKELDADDGELTRTRKVRRTIVLEKYAVLIDALYSGKTNCFIRTEVVFEDGRKGSIEGDLVIRDVPTFDALAKAS
jgi:long-chain acyl-CoA synthetase